jgi:hypothetical protein
VVPIEWKLSPKVTMRFGFEDGRIELVVTVSPLLPSVKLVMEEEEVPQAIEALEKARDWNSRRPK